MTITGNRFNAIPAGIALALLAACGGDSMNTVATSTLRLDITDAPITDATKVWLQFTGVEVKPVGGMAQTFMFSSPKGYDLLTLQNGNAATLLGDSTVPAGEYEWVRLMLDPAAGSSYIIDGSGQHDLRIPSGLETGLKLVRGFTMPAGGRADFTVDFVLGKSIIKPPGQAPTYMMKPVLRLVDNIQVGTISGTFEPLTLNGIPACANKAPIVYLYSGAGVTPDDLFNPLDGSMDTMPNVDPLVTVTATLNMASQYAYRIAFVPVGTYTVAFTCNEDDPAVDETAIMPSPITFSVYPQPVMVTSMQTSTANF